MVFEYNSCSPPIRKGEGATAVAGEVPENVPKRKMFIRKNYSII